MYIQVKEMMNSLNSVPTDIHDHMTHIMFIAILGIAIATFGNSYQLNLASYLENQSHLIRVCVLSLFVCKVFPLLLYMYVHICLSMCISVCFYLSLSFST